MSQDFEDELGAEERQALGRLVREKSPPPALEERVVASLKSAGLLRARGRSVWSSSAPRAALAVAASLLFFVLGALAGSRWVSQPERSGAPEFMLLLRSSPEQSEPPAPEEITRRVREYGDWAGQLRRQGVRVQGERLAREARFLRGSDSENNSADEVIAGYFLIEARDYEQAVKLAEGCPHLKYGGTIEVRQIARF